MGLGEGLSTLLPRGVPQDSLDLLGQMLAFSPSARITADEALQHAALAEVLSEHRSADMDMLAETVVTLPFEETKLRESTLRDFLPFKEKKLLEATLRKHFGEVVMQLHHARQQVQAN